MNNKLIILSKDFNSILLKNDFTLPLENTFPLEQILVKDHNVIISKNSIELKDHKWINNQRGGAIVIPRSHGIINHWNGFLLNHFNMPYNPYLSHVFNYLNPSPLLNFLPPEITSKSNTKLLNGMRIHSISNGFRNIFLDNTIKPPYKIFLKNNLVYKVAKN